MADVLTQVLDTLRITTTMFGMADLPDPWGVAFPETAGAYFHVLDGTSGWLQLADGPSVRVAAGDIVLLPHGAAHRLTGAGQDEVLTVFDPAVWAPNELVRPTASTGSSGVSLVCGVVDLPPGPAHPLLLLLPAVVHVGHDEPAADDLQLTLSLLRSETRGHGPGTQTLLARLGDVLLIQLVRSWVDRAGLAKAGWLGALGDPQIGAALTAMHDNPAAPWTLDSLAAVATLSRSRFAERFTLLVGQAPGQYLTRWRLSVAAGMLREGCAIREAGRAVGYSSEAAFSRAFSRQHGLPPSQVRVS
ncbi:AraC family transcriptional regulator [Acidothermaceae bacterium B102]|nr:AraC family transcriptional regulator [Acidothermaceae bacterium B102]